MNERESKRAALLIATLSSLLTPFMGSSMNLALPSIAKEFGINAVVLSWVATSYLLAAAVSLVPFGRLADIYGRKRVFTQGVILFTISSFLSAMATSGFMLIVCRVFQGIGSAMIFATGIAILTSVFPPHERGKAIGINIAAVYIGLSLGPFLGGLLTQHCTWRSVFLVTIPLGLLIIAVVRWRLPGEWAEAGGEAFDIPGTIFYGLSLVAIMAGLSLLPAMMSLVLILCGVISFLVFVVWEMHTAHPVLNLALFMSNRVFAFSNLAALINYSATFAVTFLLSLYLQHIKALSPQNAGLIMVAQPLVQAAFSPLAGSLSDRIEPRIVASAGMFITTIGLGCFTMLAEATTVLFIVGSLVVLGFGLALFASPNTNAIIGSVERKYYGLASGSVGTMRLVGMMISMGIATLVFAVLIGRVPITVEVYPSLIKGTRVAFTIFVILCLGGIAASSVRGRLRAHNNSNTTAPSAASIRESTGIHEKEGR
ncbi:MAG: MFS transporter [Deltaproteobacteria bacterium]|nr:MFS transporter [Deltaproteobacteria bacterium]